VRPLIGSTLAAESGDIDSHRTVAEAIAAGDAATAHDASRALLATGTAAIASLLATPKDK
jgi:DNA-binding FadR family transcriptional regulator